MWRNHEARCNGYAWSRPAVVRSGEKIGTERDNGCLSHSIWLPPLVLDLLLVFLNKNASDRPPKVQVESPPRTLRNNLRHAPGAFQ